MAEGGFTWGRDGRLYDWNGNHVEFTIATNEGNVQRETLMTLLAEDLTELGMTVHQNPMDFNLLVNQLTSGEGWEAIIIGLTGGVDPDGGSNVWQSDGGLHMWNIGRDGPQTEWEARVDEIFRVGRTILDPEGGSGVLRVARLGGRKLAADLRRHAARLRRGTGQHPQLRLYGVRRFAPQHPRVVGR